MSSPHEKQPQNFSAKLSQRGLLIWSVVGIIAIALLMYALVDVQPSAVADWFKRISNSPFAVPATVLIYTLTAFISAPQWMLHGGAVLAFGPIYGSFIAWCATMVSACFDYWLGKRLGAQRVTRFGGALTNRITEVVRMHGFWTSLAVRIVPTGPFIVVNMAAGASRIQFWAFFLGTGIGIIPKIATIAFLGEGLVGAASGKSPFYVGLVIVIGLVWIGLLLLAASRLKNENMPNSVGKP